MAQEYISQFSEKIEGRVTKKLSKQFSRLESGILGALTKLDEFLLNPQVRTCSVAVPGTSKNNDSENGEPIGRRFLGDPCPGVVFSACHPDNINDSEQDETHHMVIGVQKTIPYCSLGTSSGKQSQPQFRCENTTATIQADQILLALQQFASNRTSGNFNNNINGISKVPKSVKTTMPTSDCKSEKFELFEDLLQTGSKIHNQLTEQDKINYFYSPMRGDVVQTFKNITSPNRENLGEIQTVSRKKYMNCSQWLQQNTNFNTGL